MREKLDIGAAITIITAKDLRFCLEYRTVESVNLTARELAILALLITSQP